MPYAVTSPAGDTIEIMSDQGWLDLTGASPKAFTAWTLAKRPLLGALWTHGNFESASGQATAPLHRAATELGYKSSQLSVTHALNHPITALALERRWQGKRTYLWRLRALPESWYRKLDAEWPHVNGATADTAVRTPADIQADWDAKQTEAAETVAALIMPTDEDRQAADMMDAILMPADIEEPLPDMPPPDESQSDYTPAVDLEVASSVAMALLTRVIEIVSSGSPADTDRRVKQLQADLSDVADKLAKRLTENDRMRNSIRDLGEEIVALRTERDGLRKRLRAAEINLERATSADAQRYVNDEVQKEIAKVMRATPVSRKLPDDE